MAEAREEVNWDEMSKHAIDRKKFARMRGGECLKTNHSAGTDSRTKQCSMCGPFCVFRDRKPKS